MVYMIFPKLIFRVVFAKKCIVGTARIQHDEKVKVDGMWSARPWL